MSRPRPAGMTLFEVMTSLAIMAILGVLLVRIYDVSRTAFSSSTGQIALQQKARTLLDRIAPVLVSAVPRSETDPAITFPTPNPSATPIGAVPVSSTIVFTVPEPNFNPRAPKYVRAKICRHPDPLASPDRYPVGSVTLDPNIYSTDDERTRTRILAPDIQSLQFAVVAQNVVRVTIEVYANTRGARNQDKQQTYRLDSLIQIPYYSKG